MNAALSTGRMLGHSAEMCLLIRIKYHVQSILCFAHSFTPRAESN
jgi:predicted hotdog family 3-hydroxylacyl-ACP dehydratase